LAPYLVYTIWIDTDRQVAMDRGLARAGEDLTFWREWEAAEERHRDRDRPWERADLIVSNDAAVAPRDAAGDVVTAPAATWTRAARPRSPGG
jgi:dephospho-CoA kinase